MFGKDGGKHLAEEYSLELLGQLPLIESTEKSSFVDNESLKIEFLKIADKLVKSAETLKEKKPNEIPQINVTE